MSTLYVLVGVPGSGKTTWIAHQKFDWDNTVIVSTDRYVEQYAKSIGKTYNEVFQDYMPTAVELMTKTARQAFAEGKDVIWDQTSTTVKTRARKLRMAPEHYTKIAVFFEVPKPDVHVKFLDRPGKTIPEEVMKDMITKLVIPTINEGFDRIVKAKLLGVE